MGSGARVTYICIPVLLFISCVTMDILLNLFMTQFLLFQNGDIICTELQSLSELILYSILYRAKHYRDYNDFLIPLILLHIRGVHYNP